MDIKKCLTFIFFLFLASSFAIQAQAQKRSTPLMGNYKISKAVCNGEEMIWKKHDKIIFSGGFLIVGGNLTSVEDNKECRFQDIYSRLHESAGMVNEAYNETSSLLPVKRREACWDLKDGTRVEESKAMKESEITNNLTRLVAKKEGHALTIQIDESSLCDGLVTLSLEYDFQ